jgi:hypothetical protein
MEYKIRTTYSERDSEIILKQMTSEGWELKQFTPLDSGKVFVILFEKSV